MQTPMHDADLENPYAWAYASRRVVLSTPRARAGRAAQNRAAIGELAGEKNIPVYRVMDGSIQSHAQDSVMQPKR